MINWIHIMDAQPQYDERIVKIEPAYDDHYYMVLTKYKDYLTFEEYIEWCNQNDMPHPNYWWVAYKDFPFPDKI